MNACAPPPASVARVPAGGFTNVTVPEPHVNRHEELTPFASVRTQLLAGVHSLFSKVSQMGFALALEVFQWYDEKKFMLSSPARFRRADRMFSTTSV